MEEVLEKIQSKKQIYRILIMLFALTLSALVYNLFLLPLNIVSGGTGGVATITKHIYNIDPSIMILILSTICIIISFVFLGNEKTLGIIAASFLYPFLVKLTSPITDILNFAGEDMLVIAIFAGVLSGISAGLMYKTGYNSGGFNVICQILYEKFKISISKTNLIINLIIIITSSFFFGTTNAMYAIILLYINNIVLDKVLLGISKNKAFYIITSEEKEIKEYIISNLKHSVTIFDVKGGFLEKKRKVLLVVIPSKEYYRLTEGIKLIDKDAFFVVTDAYEVSGGK